MLQQLTHVSVSLIWKSILQVTWVMLVTSWNHPLLSLCVLSQRSLDRTMVVKTHQSQYAAVVVDLQPWEEQSLVPQLLHHKLYYERDWQLKSIFLVSVASLLDSLCWCRSTFLTQRVQYHLNTTNPQAPNLVMNADSFPPSLKLYICDAFGLICVATGFIKKNQMDSLVILMLIIEILIVSSFIMVNFNVSYNYTLNHNSNTINNGITKADINIFSSTFWNMLNTISICLWSAMLKS